ncbi:hypothetical protein [Microbacterium sp.]|uniref:hypothetical protein n=1 Tax=Microbacterium sp. TaxID=51671 RepID=UPI002737554A|nr:hypothetical protein [Microbacterium sp.]MDP3952095.1 hypothetical protein [Microbacterium sp.]
MSDSEPDAHVIGEGLLATPFTADEIREATGAGKTIRLLVEEPQGARYLRVNRFRETDADGATLDRWRSGVDRVVEGDISSARVSWRDLQAHAAFPAERTVLSSETLSLPIGRLECLRYDVRDGPEAAPATFWFAMTHPGMPVRYEAPVDGGVERTTIVAIEWP